MARKPKQPIEPAQLKWVTTFGHHVLNMLNLRAFASITSDCIDIGRVKVSERWVEGINQAMIDPKIKDVFESGNPPLQEKLMRNIAEAFAKRSLRIAKQTADSASLIFSHSMLDGIVSDACQISFLAHPSDWHRFVYDRKIELGSLVSGKDKKSLLNENAATFVITSKEN